MAKITVTFYTGVDKADVVAGFLDAATKILERDIPNEDRDITLHHRGACVGTMYVRVED